MSWGVIFDMDGVLVDSGRAHFEAWSELGDEIGVPFTPEFFQQTFGMHNGQILPLWLGERYDQSKLEELALRKETLYRQRAAATMLPLPGAIELVKALHQSGARLAVGSSGPLLNVALILQVLGIEPYFHALSTGDDVTHGKPHPEVFLVAAERLGLTSDRCVVVEDAPQGIEAARRAGMKVLAVTSSRSRQELEADLVVDCLTQVSWETLFELTSASSGKMVGS